MNPRTRKGVEYQNSTFLVIIHNTINPGLFNDIILTADFMYHLMRRETVTGEGAEM
jgi:hypothetical protein